MAVYPGSRFLRGIIMPPILKDDDSILLAGTSQWNLFTSVCTRGFSCPDEFKDWNNFVLRTFSFLTSELVYDTYGEMDLEDA